MIDVKEVVKQFGNHIVVENVSIKIQKEKITSFIGPNGAGKSTLLGMISRFLSKDKGEIYIKNKELSKCNSNDLAKQLSILKQSNRISIRITIRDLVSFGLR